MQTNIRIAALTLAALALSTTANASLIVAEQPAGFFFLDPVLTLQNPLGSTTATGSVGLANGIQVTTGDVRAVTQVLAIGEHTFFPFFPLLHLGFQPFGASITVNDLVLNVYSPAGTLLFTSGEFTPVTAGTFSQFGLNSVEFQLDETQRAEAIAAGAFSSRLNLIGLSASVSNVARGSEVFSVMSTDPEPETYLMLLAGLGLMVLSAKRRRCRHER
jgi:hypothetical protein